MTTPTSVWEHLDELTDGERKTLVDSAVTVLNGKLGPEEAVTPDMPDSFIRAPDIEPGVGVVVAG